MVIGLPTPQLAEWPTRLCEVIPPAYAKSLFPLKMLSRFQGERSSQFRYQTLLASLPTSSASSLSMR